MKNFIYRFLRRLFLEPDKEFYGFLLRNAGDLREVGIELDDSLSLTALQTEYTRLFLGPEEHMPPYESVFLEKRFWGDSAVDVSNFINRVGLKLDEDYSMPPDHLSVELEVLEKALQSCDREAEDLYAEFFSCHMDWVFDYLTELIPKTGLRFYKSSFAFAKVFLKEELSNISMREKV